MRPLALHTGRALAVSGLTAPASSPVALRWGGGSAHGTAPTSLSASLIDNFQNELAALQFGGVLTIDGFLRIVRRAELHETIALQHGNR